MDCLFGYFKYEYEVILIVIIYNKKNTIISEGKQQAQLGLAMVGGERGNMKKEKERGKRSNSWSPCGGW